VSFGSNFYQLFQSSQPYEDDTVRKAIQLVESFDADMGGTEIEAALLSIFTQTKQKNMPRQIFLLTDGEV
jgi:uncharacterized protein with von Willebrand factor type A (vWA) domain